jgi:hypothetical protein
MTETEDERIHALTHALEDAEDDIWTAHAALSELRTHAVEYIDGEHGPDIRHHLEDAARALRAAYALHNAVTRTRRTD